MKEETKTPALNQWIELGRKQYAVFENDCENYIKCLVANQSMRTVLNCVYNSLVGRKEMIAIENLSQEGKITLWEATKEFAKGTLNQQQMIDLSKSLYTLEYFGSK